MDNFYLVGLTGQSGAGKTTVSNMFKNNGFAVINADLVSRSVTQAGTECCKALSVHFPTCFDDNFNLDRKSLGNIVFNDKEKLKILNNTIFPFISKEIDKEIKAIVRDGENLILLDAPTLFEADIDDKCDCIVSVVADFDIRIKRILERDGIPVELVKSRFSSQLSEQFFISKSDYIIKNNTDIENLISDTDSIINQIKENANDPKESSKKS
ncbi:MAG: dephospho-CoA kinase [Clostridiales bacterium]|nr:dephospho-CoA kinase [Clostridiales bacterium]